MRTAMPVINGEAASPSPTTRPNPEPPSIISYGVASILALTSEIAAAISPEPPSIIAFNASIEVTASVTSSNPLWSNGLALSITSACASASKCWN